MLYIIDISDGPDSGKVIGINWKRGQIEGYILKNPNVIIDVAEFNGDRYRLSKPQVIKGINS